MTWTPYEHNNELSQTCQNQRDDSCKSYQYMKTVSKLKLCMFLQGYNILFLIQSKLVINISSEAFIKQ